MIAAACGHLNIVKWAIEQKAELNVQDIHGWTALHLAALKGHIECAKALVDAGADRNIRDKKDQTARSLALQPPEWVPNDTTATEGRAKIAELLK